MAGLLLLASPIAAAYMAARKGRSPLGWFLIALVTQFVGMFAVMLLSPLLCCPRCGRTYQNHEKACAGCGCTLPVLEVAYRLSRPKETYDAQCGACATPYRVDDYRPELDHIYCSWCHAELPRTGTAMLPTSAPPSTPAS